MRRLAAVLFADIAGYSRMMVMDEQDTAERVRSLLKTIVRPLFLKFSGRIIQTLGDGLVAEFQDPVQAVLCSVSLQTTIKRYNVEYSSRLPINFRIGINYGDVIVDEEDADNKLYGTDVNIAARLEQIADEGGVYVSERVVNAVGSQSEISFKSLGTRRLKNIAGRFPVFGVCWRNQEHSYAKYLEEVIQSTIPTIAILPFQNRSETHDQGQLIDAIVEDVMIELGRYTELAVISASNISADATTGIRDLGRQLGSDFVVTGSVNRLADQIIVAARLFETDGGQQIWTNRYESSLRNLLSLQEILAHDLASQLPIRIESVGLERSRSRSIESLDAYDCYIRGRALYRLKTPTTDVEAITLLERAIELDPTFADPYAILGAIKGIGWAYSSWGTDPLPSILGGRKLIRKALSLNQNLSRAHGHLGWTFLSTGNFDEAVACFDRAIALNPNDADVLLLKAYGLMYMGEPLESIRISEDLIRLNPQSPLWYKDVLAGAQFIAEDYASSLENMEDVLDMFPESVGWCAACQAHLGLVKEANVSAEKFIKRVRKIWRGPQTAGPMEYVRWFLYQASPFKISQDRDNLAWGLSKAGLPIPTSDAKLHVP